MALLALDVAQQFQNNQHHNPTEYKHRKHNKHQPHLLKLLLVDVLGGQQVEPCVGICQ